jgi:hypothetical protein
VVSPLLQGVQYQWSQDGSPFTTSSSGAYSFYGFSPSTVAISVKYTNVCGTSSAITGYYSSPCAFRVQKLKVSQLKDHISISSDDAKAVFQKIEVYDMNGIRKMEIRAPKGQRNVLVNIASLPAGIYILKIYDGKRWQIEKFIK